ncbi:leucine-rich repeat extensin-like protein 1 [Phalaenopsis equestris]|uniref:leucine-rich repeat extensin-like protein 1 n=1 Tax=Phalaenopsis equestris TaxID=78828 RepID=UPI0009E3DA9B|nr:leucine-rich repeat extensin-like protein 1 [Phalaenopsis equestris]
MNPIPDPKRDVPISSYVLTSMQPPDQQFRQHPSHVQQFQQQQQQQQQQQPPPQFIQANPNPQYIHHPATGTVLSYPAYYQMPIQQSQQSHPYDQQQYPFYYLPVRQNPPPPQPYNMSIATSHPDVSSQVKPAAATTFSKPIPAKPEQQANIYRMAAMGPPQPNNATPLPTTVSQPLIHLSSDQVHPYSGMNYHVMHHHHPSQQQPAAAATTTTVAANFGYEQTGIPPVYYTQTTSPPGLAPTQYQTMVTSPDAATAAVAAASILQPGEVKQTRAS